MPSSRTSRRAMAITRNQRSTPRELFLAEVRNSLPRVNLSAQADWAVAAASIECAIFADRLLRAGGFDRWGNSTSPQEPTAQEAGRDA